MKRDRFCKGAHDPFGVFRTIRVFEEGFSCVAKFKFPVRFARSSGSISKSFVRGFFESKIGGRQDHLMAFDLALMKDMLS